MKYRLSYDVQFANFIFYPKGTEIIPLSDLECSAFCEEHNIKKSSFFSNSDRMFKIGEHKFWLIEEEWEQYEN